MNYPVNLYSSWSTLLPSPSLRPSVPGHNPSLKSFYSMFWNYEKAVFKELMVWGQGRVKSEPSSAGLLPQCPGTMRMRRQSLASSSTLNSQKTPKITYDNWDSI